MNEIVSKILLTEDKLKPKLHLRQPRFTFSACGSLTIHRDRIQKFKQTGDLNDIYNHELDKACFVHNDAHVDSKDLVKRTVWNNILKYRAYDISLNTKYDGYQERLASMVHKYFENLCQV